MAATLGLVFSMPNVLHAYDNGGLTGVSLFQANAGCTGAYNMLFNEIGNADTADVAGGDRVATVVQDADGNILAFAEDAVNLGNGFMFLPVTPVNGVGNATKAPFTVTYIDTTVLHGNAIAALQEPIMDILVFDPSDFEPNCDGFPGTAGAPVENQTQENQEAALVEQEQQAIAVASTTASIAQVGGMVSRRIATVRRGGSPAGRISGGDAAAGTGRPTISPSDTAPQSSSSNTGGATIGGGEGRSISLANAGGETAMDLRGLTDLAAGRVGMAAGEGESKWGIWANFSWSGIEDQTAVAGTDGNVATGIVGADFQFAENAIAGVAVSLGGASFESRVTAFDTDEMSIGITPYIAYQITDTLSVDALAGYSFGVGESTRAETITGHYGIHRYFLGANTSWFQTWDRWSVLASGGFTWGQSFENAYTESDLTRVGSRKTDLGSIRFLAQPAYLFDLDAENGVFLEPYLLGEYSYDFVISKIAGHNNDRDAFRVGAGLNLFSGDSMSGNLEGSTMLGREDQRNITVGGTLRYNF